MILVVYFILVSEDPNVIQCVFSIPPSKHNHLLVIHRTRVPKTSRWSVADESPLHRQQVQFVQIIESLLSIASAEQITKVLILYQRVIHSRHWTIECLNSLPIEVQGVETIKIIEIVALLLSIPAEVINHVIELHA